MALDRLTKVDGGGISTTSDYRVGIITASKFVGPFDGTGGNFSGVVTATNGVFSGNISAVDGNFSGNVTIGGTLTYEDVTNIDSVGIITAQKDIHVGAGLSVVGVSTFSEGLFAPDNKQFKLGNTAASPDFKIYHNTVANTTSPPNYLYPNSNYIDSVAAANLFIRTSTAGIYLGRTDGAHAASFHTNGSVVLYYNDSGSGGEKFRTTSYGGIFGNQTPASVSTPNKLSLGAQYSGANRAVPKLSLYDDGTNELGFGVSSYQIDLILFDTQRDFVIYGAGSEKFRFKGDGRLKLLDGKKIQFGDSEDLQFVHEGGHSRISNVTGDLRIEGNRIELLNGSANGGFATETYLTATNGGAVELYYNNHKSFNTNANGITLTAPEGGDCVIDMNADEGDDNPDKWRINISQGGSFQIKNYADGSWENHIQTTINSSVQLYNNGNVKLETKGYGIDITGGFITTGGSIVQDGGDIKFGTGSDLQVRHDNSNNINVIQCHNGRTLHIDKNNGSANMAKFIPDGAVELYHSGTKKFETTTNGIEITGKVQVLNNGATASSIDGTVDIRSVGGSALLVGSTNAGGALIKIDGGADGDGANGDYTRIRHMSNGVCYFDNLHTAREITFRQRGEVEVLKIISGGNIRLPIDNQKLEIGASQDLQLYHDNNGDSNIFNNTGHLTITNNTSGKIINLQPKSGANGIIARYEGAVELYHNGTKRFETTISGVTVTGEVAASQDYPNLKPTLDLNFAGTSKLDSRVTFKREGSGSYYGRDGLLKFAATNEPRFDHDPITRECKGLLIEEQRQNFAPNSYRASNDDGGTNYDHGYNMINGAVAINDFGTAPDGTNTATKMYPASSGNGRGIELITSVPSTGNYTNSIYVKAAGHTGWIALYGINGGTRAYFNPTTGAKGSASQSSTPNAEDYDIQDVGNGWYRIHLTVNQSNLAAADYHYIYFGDADGSTSVTASGTNGILMWGLQIEKGDFPTSYIRTDSFNKHYRGADQCYIDGQDFLDFYNPTESTVVCEFNSSNWLTYNNNAYERIWSISNGSETDLFEMFKQNTDNNNIRYRVRDGNANVLGASNITYGTNTTPKMAFALKLNDAAVAVDGAISGTGDTSIPMPTVDQLILGNDDNFSNNTLNAHIKRFMYYPVKLSDSQVVTMTS